MNVDEIFFKQSYMWKKIRNIGVSLKILAFTITRFTPQTNTCKHLTNDIFPNIKKTESYNLNMKINFIFNFVFKPKTLSEYCISSYGFMFNKEKVYCLKTA